MPEPEPGQDEAQLLEGAFWMLATRISEFQAKEAIRDGLFAYNRHGVRAAIAAIEDETQELWTAWNDTKRHMGNGIAEIRHELLDIAADAMVCYLESFK